jgi:hypothetical protein
MSYSMEDFFEEHIVKHLAEHSEDSYEHFLGILRNAVNSSNRGTDFAKKLLEIATNPNETDMSPEQFIKNSFGTRYDELEIRKFEYATADGTIVQANYQGDQERQELQDKIATQMASPWNRQT